MICPNCNTAYDEEYTLCLECGAKLVNEKELEDPNKQKYLKRIAELESEIAHLKYDILKKDEYIELLKKDLQRDYEKFKNMKQDIKSLNEKLEKISKDNEELNYKLLKYEQD